MIVVTTAPCFVSRCKISTFLRRLCVGWVGCFKGIYSMIGLILNSDAGILQGNWLGEG